MKIEAAVLCDSAQVANGKLFILDDSGWNMYGAVSLPVTFPIALAVDVSFTRNQAGIQFPFVVTISDEAGVPIIPTMNHQIESEASTQELPKGTLLKLPLAINTGLVWPRPGWYNINVNVGSSKAHRVLLDAIFTGNKVALADTPEDEKGN